MTESRNTYLPDELRKRFTLKCSEKNYRYRKKDKGGGRKIERDEKTV